ncbi:TetR/AcrR family transcriptional regulator [Kitasatospora sp. NPDC088346]|uniref:TetR/AcrR family transcriptional regulator n=1 Tax=Kitasatospora sp. NPDC088346 TaxID=3364073 RepID=UPI003815F765
MQERTYHHGSLRTALLDAAERAVLTGGAQSLSLRELAREVGVSHAAPRRHFADRAALLDALGQRGFDQLARHLEAAIAAAPGSLGPRLRAVAHAYVDFTRERMPLIELMFAGKHREGADATLAAAQAAYAVPFAVIESAHRSGELAQEDVRAAARLVFATVHGLAVLLNSGMIAREDVTGTVDAAVDGLLTGVASTGGRTP